MSCPDCIINIIFFWTESYPVLHLEQKNATLFYFYSLFETMQNSFHQSHEVPLHAKYGGRNTVTLIPGDGIGPEMVTAVQDIFRCFCFTMLFYLSQVQMSSSDISLKQKKSNLWCWQSCLRLLAQSFRI